MTIDKIAEEIRPPHGTDLLCRNLVETTFDKLSEENVRIFKDRLLDITGCIFGGAVVQEDRFFYDTLQRWGGLPEAPIFAARGKLPLINAVMHNCLHARANDFGAMLYVVMGDSMASHFGETLIPMGLTLADMNSTSGQDFITNNIAAEDTIGRILYSMPMRWPTDMQLVSSAAAALASRYYKLDAVKAKVALSYAATNCTDPGNSYYDYSQEFKYHNAESARMGIMAAELAKGGWQGLEDPYYGHWGLISKQLGKEDDVPALYAKSFEDLSKVYFTEQRFKRFPGGIPTTASARCGQMLHEQLVSAYGKVDPDQIKQVRVLPSKYLGKNYYNNPFTLRNHTNALFSYQFSACCALLNGTINVEMVQTDAILKNPALIRIAENSTIGEFDEGPENRMIKTVVEMKDGKVFEASADFISSMFEYPSQEIIRGKFWSQFNAFGKLPRSVGEKIIETAGKIETVSDMREYTQLLTLK